MISRNDLLDYRSPDGIEVWQLTCDPEVASSHVYYWAHAMTSDSRKVLLHRGVRDAHRAHFGHPRHAYLLCDLGSDGDVRPVVSERGALAPSIGPDDAYLYYFVDETGSRVDGSPDGTKITYHLPPREACDGRLVLKRVRLDGTDRTELLSIPVRFSESVSPLSLPFPVSSVSSDGKRIALPCCFGEDVDGICVFGVLVIDLVSLCVTPIECGPSFWCMHAQYCRCLDSEAGHLLALVSSPYSWFQNGELCSRSEGSQSDAIYLLRDDDGQMTSFLMPEGDERSVSGHICWRGKSPVVLALTSALERRDLVEARIHPDAVAVRPLVRSEVPFFRHFATDASGTFLLSDHKNGALYITRLTNGSQPEGPCYLLNTKTSPKSGDPHVFLSPDGRRGFFNSDESGRIEAYMITGLENIEWEGR